MYRQLLKDFFKRHGVHDPNLPSPQAMAHFYLKMDINPEARNAMNSVMNESLIEDQTQRLEDIAREKSDIASAIGYEQLVRMMRRGVDPLVRSALIEKALEFEKDIIPDVVRRLKTNLSDGFVENAVRLLVKSEINTAEELMNYYDDMRNPYTQSLVLILLGFRADVSIVPWLIDRFYRLRMQYPGENYSDGAYYALLEIESRLNDDKK